MISFVRNSLFLIVVGVAFISPANAQSDEEIDTSVSPLPSMSVLREHFVKDKTDLPTDAFLAFYFDSTKPLGKPVYHEKVPTVDMNYLWDKGPHWKLDSERFAGYWIGNIDIAKETTYRFYVDQSWSRTVIYIDGEIISNLNNRGGTATIDLSPGKHIIEIAHANYFHTVGLSVSIQADKKLLTDAQVKREIKTIRRKEKGVDAWYAGIHTSTAKDNKVTLSLPATKTPVILVLNSLSTVHWNIHASEATSVVGILLTDLQLGSTITGIPASVPSWYLNTGLGIYTRFPDDHNTCTQRKCLDIQAINYLRGIFGKHVNKFAITYGDDELSFSK